jgi:hypothetical protein
MSHFFFIVDTKWYVASNGLMKLWREFHMSQLWKPWISIIVTSVFMEVSRLLKSKVVAVRNKLSTYAFKKNGEVDV